MTNTAARIFAALYSAHATVTATAAALGVSKQTYSIARQRLSISDDLCVRACAVLGLDPAPALASLHLESATNPETIAVWKNILDRLTRQPQATNDRTTDSNTERNEDADSSRHNAAQNTNYALIECVKNSAAVPHGLGNNAAPDTPDSRDTIRGDALIPHLLPLSDRIKSAERLVKWMLCVPGISPASRRFKYYSDNWHVLDKIQRFTDSGEFETITKDCPAFSAEELRAALDYLDDSDTIEKPRHTTESETERQALAR